MPEIIWHLRVFCCCFLWSHINVKNTNTPAIPSLFSCCFGVFSKKKLYVLSFQMRYLISNAESSLVYGKSFRAVEKTRWHQTITFWYSYQLHLVIIFDQNSLKWIKEKLEYIILWKIMLRVSPNRCKMI